MMISLVVITLLHLFGYGILTYKWSKIKLTKKDKSNDCFSVIVPVRNEEQVIQRLLVCLSIQEYPMDQYEVIIVDDFSQDLTASIVKAFQKRSSMKLRLIHLENMDQKGKKHALTKGIENAQFENILTTDADCQMGPYWISCYSGMFQQYHFIAGPVALKGNGLFQRMQQIEFAGLIGFGAVTIEENNPSMCSGANLGFTKTAFNEVGGYSNNIQIASGDDEFLLYNVVKRFPNQAKFLKNKSAIVISDAQKSLTDFINQRMRWTSKWKYNRNWKLRLMAILFFIDNAMLVSFIWGMIAGDITLVLGLSMVLARLVIDYLYLSSVSYFVGTKSILLPLMTLQIIYPFHVLFMGISSIFGSYTWKGRKY